MTMIALVALTSLSALAQRPSAEEMQARRAEQVEKQADRLAKDFGLKDKAKADFIATYKAYQKELQGVQQERRIQPRSEEENNKLTDEEAQKRLDEYFARQEKQITTQLQRLEIERRYYTELQKTLTAKQLVKIFGQRNNRFGGQQRPGGYGPQGRPGGARPNGGGGFDGFGEGF